MRITLTLLVPLAVAASLCVSHAQRSEKSVYESLKSTKIDQISLHESPLRTALDELAKKFQESSGRKLRIRHLDNAKIPDVAKPFDLDGFGGTVTANLKEVSALEALRMISDLGGCQFVVWGDEIVVFSIFVEDEPFRLAVWELGSSELKHLIEMGVTVFDGGKNIFASVPFEKFLGSRAELGLQTKNPFESHSIDAAPGSFAAVIRGEWTPSFLVVYNSESAIDLVEILMDGFEYLWWFDDNYFENSAKGFEEMKGWSRVESVLKATELHPDTALTWPAELDQLVTLAKTLKQLKEDPEALEIEPEAVPERIERIRQLMLKLADRYTESLRLYGKVQKLVPDRKPSKKDEDLFSDDDSRIDRVYSKPRAKGNEKDEQGDAVQPATAVDSKAEGREKLKPESKGRSQ